MPIPENQALYDKVKAYADKVYEKPSAYKSGFIVKKYKELGGTYKDDKKPKNLARWFKEDWGDIGGKEYPTYRPFKRVSKDTPLTAFEIDPKQAKEQIKLKQEIKGEANLPPFIPKERKGSGIVQSIVFDKSKYNVRSARKWLKENQYEDNGVDRKENTLRFRQKDPTMVESEGFTEYRTKPIGDGSIKLVLAYKKRQMKGQGVALQEIPNIPKSNEIWKWSNPTTVRKMADEYLGKDVPVYLSNKKDKKYMVQDPDGKWIHFGQLKYEDFTKHQNPIRRKNYLTRTSGIRGDWKSNKYSANSLSRNILW